MNKSLWTVSLLFLSAVVSAQDMPAKGDAEAGKNKVAICMGCHGIDGISPADIWPSHAGQGESYLIKQLGDFKAGRRKDPIMSVQAIPLNDQDILDIAAYFSAIPSPKGTKVATQTEEMQTLGEQIYHGGIIERQIPACSGCHGADGLGIELAKFPRLSGQKAVYMRNQLVNFRNGAAIDQQFSDAPAPTTAMPRTNDPSSMMRDISSRMTDKEMEAVTNYIQSMGSDA